MSAAFEYPAKEAGAVADASGEVLHVPKITADVFWQTREVGAAIERAVADRRFARARVNVHEGDIDTACDIYATAATPALIILETSAERDQLLADLDRLAAVSIEMTKLILIGHSNDIGLYRRLIEIGVSDYVLAPLEPLTLVEAVARLYRGPGTKALGRVLAFVGAKGGCGSSTIAHNVGWTIAKSFDQQVLLIDLDLPFGTAGLDFQREDARGLSDALEDLDSLDELKLERLLTSLDDNLSLLSAPAHLGQTYDLAAAAFENLLELARQSVPVVLLDIPHGWHAWIKDILIAADDVVITAEPDLANFRNLKNLHELIARARPNDAPPKLILNKVGTPKRAELKPKDMEKYLELAPIASVDFDAKTFSAAANAGKMLADAGGAHARLLQSVEEIAAAVTGRSLGDRAKSSGLASLLGRLSGRDRNGAGGDSSRSGSSAVKSKATRTSNATTSSSAKSQAAPKSKSGPMRRRKRAAG